MSSPKRSRVTFYDEHDHVAGMIFTVGSRAGIQEALFNVVRFGVHFRIEEVKHERVETDPGSTGPTN